MECGTDKPRRTAVKTFPKSDGPNKELSLASRTDSLKIAPILDAACRGLPQHDLVLPDSGWPNQDDIFGLGDELQFSEGADLFAVDTGVAGEGQISSANRSGRSARRMRHFTVPPAVMPTVRARTGRQTPT